MVDDTERERQLHDARRYGFVDGSDFVISGVLHLLTEEQRGEVEAWATQRLRAWRDADNPHLPPPAFPVLEDET